MLQNIAMFRWNIAASMAEGSEHSSLEIEVKFEDLQISCKLEVEVVEVVEEEEEEEEEERL
jgi:hypothetical protein